MVQDCSAARSCYEAIFHRVVSRIEQRPQTVKFLSAKAFTRVGRHAILRLLVPCTSVFSRPFAPSSTPPPPPRAPPLRFIVLSSRGRTPADAVLEENKGFPSFTRNLFRRKLAKLFPLRSFRALAVSFFSEIIETSEHLIHFSRFSLSLSPVLCRGLFSPLVVFLPVVVATQHAKALSLSQLPFFPVSSFLSRSPLDRSLVFPPERGVSREAVWSLRSSCSPAPAWGPHQSVYRGGESRIRRED